MRARPLPLRFVVLSLAAVLALAGCKGELGVEADLSEGLSHLGVRLTFTGIAAEVLSEQPELRTAITELLEERVGVSATVSAEGGAVVFYGAEKVPAANVFTASPITGVKGLAVDSANQLVVRLAQPTELVSAIVDSSGDDASLANTILETTLVTVYVTGAEDATLVEGNAGDAAFSGSHLAVSRPLSRSGEETYVFSLPGVDPIVIWGLGITAAVVALSIGVTTWRRRRLR